MRTNAQVARRTEEYHYPAYDLSVEDDRDTLNEILGQLVMSLPVKELKPELLEKHRDEIFYKCAGCVGILKDWLSRALLRALEDNRENVEYVDLQETAVAADRLETIVDAVVDFREGLNGKSEYESIRRKLGLVGGKMPVEEKRTTAKQKRPGKRLPYRDAVPRSEVRP